MVLYTNGNVKQGRTQIYLPPLWLSQVRGLRKLFVCSNSNHLLWLGIQKRMVLAVFQFGLGFGHFSGDLAGVIEKVLALKF